MTYRELKRLLADWELPTMGRNQDNELVLIEEGQNAGEHFYKLTSVQHNDWLRINIYYEDGTMEELYRK